MRSEHVLPSSSLRKEPEAVAQEKDPAGDLLFGGPEELLAASNGGDGRVKIGATVLSRFTGSTRTRLLRYLAGSAEWWLTRRDGKLVAYRRFVNNGGMWFAKPDGCMSPASDLIDYYDSYLVGDRFPKLGTERIAISCDGPTLALPYLHDTTEVRADSAEATVKMVDRGDLWDGRYASNLVVTSGGPALEIYEATAYKSRPFTSAAVAHVETELAQVLSRTHPRVPPCSTKRGRLPEAYVVHHGNNVFLCGYVNPGEDGYIYTALFDTDTRRRFEYRWTHDNTIEYTGSSSDPLKLFYFCVPLFRTTGDTPLDMELRFVPASGGKERCLASGRIYGDI